MKFLIMFSLILSVSSVGFAAEAVGYFKDKAHPGKCVYDTLILSSGENAKLPDACGRFICGAHSFGIIHTCGVMAPPLKCKYTGYIDVNAPYPECCKMKLVC